MASTASHQSDTGILGLATTGGTDICLCISDTYVSLRE